MRFKNRLMRGKLVFGLMIVMMAVAMAQNGTCAVEIVDVKVGQHPTCADGVEITDAEIYTGEAFYVCAEFDTPTGTLTAYESSTVPKQDRPLQNSVVIVNGMANTQQHKIYYVTLNMTSPCSAMFTVPIEIKSRCVQLPPSTIQIVPNAIMPGQDFTVEVANAPKDMDMIITGLAAPVTARIAQEEVWTRAFPSTECPTGCDLKFSFTDPKHPSCHNEDTTIQLRILEAPPENAETTETMDELMIFILAIVLVGTITTILLASR